MATSGSYIAEALVGSDIKYPSGTLEFHWERTSVDLYNNTSTISWRVVVTGKNGFHSNSGNEKLAISLVYFDANGAGHVLHSEDKEVNVNTDADGSKTLFTGSTAIPHDNNPSNSFRFSMYDYSAGDGNADLWFFRDIIAPIGLIETKDHFPQTFYLDSLNRGSKITNVYEFNDEQNVSIGFNHYAPTTSALAFLSFSDEYAGFAYNNIDGSINAKEGTISLSDADRNKIRQTITEGSSKPIRVYLESKVGGKTYREYQTTTVTLVNHEPIINPVIVDINENTLRITEDENILIRYMSNAYFTTGAQGRKGATIVSQSVTSDSNKTIEDASGTIEGITGGRFDFRVTDSRGIVTQQTIEKTIIPYVRLTALARIEELDLLGNLTFSISGQYYEGSLGILDNSLNVLYTLKKNGQPIATEVLLNPKTQGTFTLENNQYTYRYTITGLEVNEDDLNDSFSIQATVYDALITIETDEKTTSATPMFEWNKEQFNFNVPVHFGRGFTNDIGLNTAQFSRVVTIDKAAAYPIFELYELGINSSNVDIYSISGTIVSDSGRIYPIPTPALTNGVLDVPAYSLGEATKFWIDGEQVYLTTGAAWGTVRVRIVIMYF